MIVLLCSCSSKKEATEGKLSTELCIWVSADWESIPGGEHTAQLTIKSGHKSIEIEVSVSNSEITFASDGYLNVQ